jgi:hypothetical protein
MTDDEPTGEIPVITPAGAAATAERFGPRPARDTDWYVRHLTKWLEQNEQRVVAARGGTAVVPMDSAGRIAHVYGYAVGWITSLSCSSGDPVAVLAEINNVCVAAHDVAGRL